MGSHCLASLVESRISRSADSVKMHFSPFVVSGLFLATAFGEEQNNNKLLNRESWNCPEYGMAFNGNDLAFFEEIPSWEECGMLCNEEPGCTHWEWTVPIAEFNARICYLKTSDGGAARWIDGIVGDTSCFSAC